MLRFAGNEVDRAAHGVEAVHQRCAGFGGADFGQAGGGEAGEVDVAVVGDVLRDAVEKQGHLAGGEAAHADAGFVAAAGKVDTDARLGGECLGDVPAVAAADVCGADDAFVRRRVAPPAHGDFAQREGGLGGGLGGVWAVGGIVGKCLRGKGGGQEGG